MKSLKERLRIPWPKGAVMAAMILVAAHFAGCTGIGPQTIDRDRFDYVSAISDSWKRQTLLNLLKTRYLDAPVFMDVASVINQYGLEQEVGLGVSGEFYNKGEPSFVSPEIGVKGRYTDRPTITYNPLMGENYARSVLKPISNSAILLLVEAGRIGVNSARQPLRCGLRTRQALRKTAILMTPGMPPSVPATDSPNPGCGRSDSLMTVRRSIKRIEHRICRWIARSAWEPVCNITGIRTSHSVPPTPMSTWEMPGSISRGGLFRVL
jgi:hypothetical protein